MNGSRVLRVLSATSKTSHARTVRRIQDSGGGGNPPAPSVQFKFGTTRGFVCKRTRLLQTLAEILWRRNQSTRASFADLRRESSQVMGLAL